MQQLLHTITSIILLLQLLHSTATTSQLIDDNSEVFALRYLKRFGYLNDFHVRNRRSSSSNKYHRALFDFQRMAGLPATGRLDKPTIKMMHIPRCGNMDRIASKRRKKRFVLQGSKWEKTDLKYRIGKYPKRLDKSEVDEAISKALNIWANSSSLTFKQIRSNDVSMKEKTKKQNPDDLTNDKKKLTKKLRRLVDIGFTNSRGAKHLFFYHFVKNAKNKINSFNQTNYSINQTTIVHGKPLSRNGIAHSLNDTNKRKNIDFIISFEQGDHGDGEPFDGMGGVLGHAFFPQYGGDAHFDYDEYWTSSSFDGVNLMQVAAHEIGHTLGLEHSDENSALMAPFFRGFSQDFTLHSDDIRAIQALYGPPNDQYNSSNSPTPFSTSFFSSTSHPSSHQFNKDTFTHDYVNTTNRIQTPSTIIKRTMATPIIDQKDRRLLQYHLDQIRRLKAKKSKEVVTRSRTRNIFGPSRYSKHKTFNSRRRFGIKPSLNKRTTDRPNNRKVFENNRREMIRLLKKHKFIQKQKKNESNQMKRSNIIRRERLNLKEIRKLRNIQFHLKQKLFGKTKDRNKLLRIQTSKILRIRQKQTEILKKKKEENWRKIFNRNQRPLTSGNSIKLVQLPSTTISTIVMRWRDRYKTFTTQPSPKSKVFKDWRNKRIWRRPNFHQYGKTIKYNRYLNNEKNENNPWSSSKTNYYSGRNLNYLKNSHNWSKRYRTNYFNRHSPTTKYHQQQQIPRKYQQHHSIRRSTINICKNEEKIDAISIMANGNLFIFINEFYFEINNGKIVENKPKFINKNFKGKIIPQSFDAVLTWANGKTFFFKNRIYWRGTNTKIDDGYPKLISTGFVGLNESNGFYGNLDAAFVWSGNQKTYFIKGNKYWRYSIYSNEMARIDDGYPKPLNLWEGLPSNIKAAFQNKNHVTYFLGDNGFYAFDDINFTVKRTNGQQNKFHLNKWINCSSRSTTNTTGRRRITNIYDKQKYINQYRRTFPQQSNRRRESKGNNFHHKSSL
ncbi:hypothetical protein SNEBB_008989 [Seison nebaliae]|nr:hypothetical protein SNEBB_008989 [Seison nebaliae]